MIKSDLCNGKLPPLRHFGIRYCESLSANEQVLQARISQDQMGIISYFEYWNGDKILIISLCNEKTFIVITTKFVESMNITSENEVHSLDELIPYWNWLILPTEDT